MERMPGARDWTDQELYVLQEWIGDFQDGFLSRRELLRRATLITGSMAVTLSLLPALGCDLQRPGGAGTAPTAPGSATGTPVASPYATPPASRTSDGITVRPDDPRITAGAADVPGPAGATLMAYLARPRRDGRYPGILVVHENRGLVEHVKDVCRRVATAGFAALGIDLLSRQGGVARLGEPNYPAELTKVPLEAQLADERAALDHLGRQPFVDGNRLASVGFCFGGGIVWNLVATGAPLKAAAPYYGPAPRDLEGLGRSRIPVFAVYAERDENVNRSIAQVEDQLKRSGTAYQLTIYPGVGHAFHNDTGERYTSAEQAQRAWVGTIEWFMRHLTA
jgi:carboxymethylenebutenolidase